MAKKKTATKRKTTKKRAVKGKAIKKRPVAKRSRAKKKRAKIAKGIPKRWVQILRLIPGYDPIATAGDCVFDVKAADIAVEFFEECLHHSKGTKAGELFKLEKWEKAVVGNTFGWKRPDGTRRYREVFLYIPRKNGKTTLAAGIVLLILYVEQEPGAEIYSAAADRDQARQVFDQAVGMVRSEVELYSRGTVYTKAISLNDGSGDYKPISADANTKHGYNVSAAVIDELHAQRSRDLVDALITGTAARRQPLIIHVTTADFDRPSICNEKHDYATKVRDGVIEDRAFLPILYEPDENANWQSKRVWKKVNPNVGISFPMNYLEREFERAKETPAYENTFKRLHLNMKTEQAIRWLPLDKWDLCAKKPKTGDDLIWTAGLDLASTTDIAALVLFCLETFSVLPFFWIPTESAYTRERRDRVPYLTWGREGLITTTEGNVIDFDIIRRDIGLLGEKHNIKTIAVDRWGSQQIQTQLTGDGFDIEPFGQGFASMSGPTKELEKLVVGGKLRHGGNKILRWMAGNVAVEQDAADNLKPSKKRSFERIDGMVALIMAIGAAMAGSGEDKESVYNKRGVKFL